jgi:hypothetical protein
VKVGNPQPVALLKRADEAVMGEERRSRSVPARLLAVVRRQDGRVAVKSRSDTVGLFVGHDEKGKNCVHWSRDIGSRTLLRLLN